MRCLIVSGGSLDDEFVRTCCDSGLYDYFVAADAGMDFFCRSGLCPNLVIGDFDSAQSYALVSDTVMQLHTDDAAEKSQYNLKNTDTEWIRLDPVKNDTDTEAAIREVICRGACEITILGGTGTRLDHVLANMALLGIGLEEDVSIQLLDSHNRIRMINRPLTICRSKQYGRYVSLVPFSDYVEGVTLEGMKYPLRDYTMGGFNSLGISNEIIAEEAVISFRRGVLLVIESKD